MHQVAHTALNIPDQPEPGQPISADVTVTNPDRSRRRRVQPRNLPDGWSVEPPAAVVPALSPGETTTLRFEVSPPPHATPRRYNISADIRVGSLTYQPADSILLTDLVRVVSPAKLSRLEIADVGEAPYVDRNWQIQDLPDDLRGQVLVPGANDDKQRQPGPMTLVDGRARVAGGNVTLATEGADWDDYSVEVTVRPRTGGTGVMFRSQGRSNGYMWQLYPGSGLTPHILENGRFRKLTNTIPMDVAAGHDYRLRIELAGSTIRTYVDGRLIDEGIDDTFTSGTIGFS